MRATPTTPDQSSAVTTHDDQEKKLAEAKRITELMGLFKLEYTADTISCDEDRRDTVAEKESVGHQYYLDAIDCTQFPSLPGETWVDDRDNDGDLAQSIVDRLAAIADDYRAVAEEVAKRLDRTPVAS